MENSIDFLIALFFIIIGITILYIISVLILKMVKHIIKTNKRNAQRKARKKLRVLRNEMIKTNLNRNVSAIL